MIRLRESNDEVVCILVDPIHRDLETDTVLAHSKQVESLYAYILFKQLQWVQEHRNLIQNIRFLLEKVGVALANDLVKLMLVLPGDHVPFGGERGAIRVLYEEKEAKNTMFW